MTKSKSVLRASASRSPVPIMETRALYLRRENEPFDPQRQELQKRAWRLQNAYARGQRAWLRERTDYAPEPHRAVRLRVSAFDKLYRVVEVVRATGTAMFFINGQCIISGTLEPPLARPSVTAYKALRRHAHCPPGAGQRPGSSSTPVSDANRRFATIG